MSQFKTLLTAQEMIDFLESEIKKGNGDNYLFIGELTDSNTLKNVKMTVFSDELVENS